MSNDPMPPARNPIDPAASPHHIARPLMLHRWELLTFLHWRYDASAVQRLVPPHLTVETCDGSAWVGLVPFYMRVAPPFGPVLPWAGQFCETNVRTYVRDATGRSGVWFFSLDAARLPVVATARAAYRLPYFWSDMELGVRGDRVAYTCRRRWPGPAAHSRVEIAIGDRYERGDLGELDHWLTARWNVFSVIAGRTLFTRAEHPPWPLRRASVVTLDDGLVRAAGLSAPPGEPLVHYSPGVRVRLGPPEREKPSR